MAQLYKTRTPQRSYGVAAPTDAKIVQQAVNGPGEDRDAGKEGGSQKKVEKNALEGP